MERGTMSRWILGIFLLAMTGLLLGGCAALAPKKTPALVPAKDGMAIYKDKYEFKAPLGWSLLQNLEGGDFELGFLAMEKGAFPSQTTFMYDPEPFGSSRDLDTRGKQYCTRFLFNSGISPEIKKQEKVEVMGLPALSFYLEGENPNRAEKAQSKIYLVKKGDRIISFVCTQWRPIDGTFDPSGFDRFEEFVKSFRFVKKTFYEDLEAKMKKLGI